MHKEGANYPKFVLKMGEIFSDATVIKTFDSGLCVLLEQYCLAHFLSEIYRQLACVNRGKETFKGVEITLGIDRISNAYQIFTTCYCFDSMKASKYR